MSHHHQERSDSHRPRSRSRSRSRSYSRYAFLCHLLGTGTPSIETEILDREGVITVLHIVPYIKITKRGLRHEKGRATIVPAVIPLLLEIRVGQDLLSALTRKTFHEL